MQIPGTWLSLSLIGAACMTGCAEDDGVPKPITVNVFPDGALTQKVTGNADLFAVRDGERAWQAVTGDRGVYHFFVTSDRYAIAIGCVASTDVYYQSVDEAPELAVSGCPPRVLDHDDVTVTVSHAVQDADKVTTLWVGDTSQPEDGSGSFLIGVDKGVHDVLAVRGPRFDQGGNDIEVYRGSLDVQTDLAIAIDWASALPVETVPFAIQDPAPSLGDWLVQSSSLAPTGGSFRLIGEQLDKAASYPVLAAAQRQPGDLIHVEVSQRIVAERAGIGRLTRSAFQDVQTPTALTLQPPDYLEVTPPMIDTAAVDKLAVTLPIQPAALGDGASRLGYSISSASFSSRADFLGPRSLRMVVRPGWAQSASTVTLTVPDLHQLAGWRDDMALSNGAPVYWMISSADHSFAIDAPASDGRRGVETMVEGQAN